jgi:hypothetical protein
MSEKSEFEIAIETTPAPLPMPTFAEQVAGILEASDIQAPPAVVLEIEKLANRESFRRAGEAISTILGRLPGGRRGAELRLALLGGISATEARKLGIFRQNLHRSVDRLRARIFKNG